ncbi:Rv1678 family membrane protein [Pseudarthrobacter sp. H2]|uniref:Rv1678 family membrane protein n=1 Tax=Pseudarthrobacter sp. H2 TaxID=3418415 RepID=UPI003CEDB1F5
MTGPRSARRARLDQRTRRRALILSAVTAASAVFALIDYDPLKLVPVNPVQAVVLLVLALIAFAGTVLRLRALLYGVGAVMIVLGLIRLFTYGHGTGLITGSVGTAALLAGLGLAYIGTMLAGNKPDI